jgi:NADPH:quinone reductase-like Zn-dependent oxidoreductase
VAGYRGGSDRVVRDHLRNLGSRKHQEDLVRAVDADGLKPVVDRVFPLSDPREAFLHQEAQAHFGKICIDILIGINGCTDSALERTQIQEI